MSDQLTDQARVAHNEHLLELEVEHDIKHLGGKRLVEPSAGLLPRDDAISRPQHLQETQQLRKAESVAKTAPAGRRLRQEPPRHPRLTALLRGPGKLADLRLRKPSRIVRSRWHSPHMVDQRFQESNVPAGSLLARYLQGQRDMDRLHDGDRLRIAAHSLLAQLPDGPFTLLASSETGAGLAAACAVLRDQPTIWRQINVLTDLADVTGRVAIVEPIDAGKGWRAMLERRFPIAIFLTPAAVQDTDLGLAA